MILLKQDSSSLYFLNMVLDNDEEWNFVKWITRTTNLKKELDVEIPAYLQLFWTIKENKINIKDQEE